MAIRKASPEELEGMRPVVSNEQGVTNFERFNLTTLANDPDTAKLWLRSRGYEVLPYGKHFNFAVRKQGEQEWRVVDPEGLDLNDVLIDFLPGLAIGAVTEVGRVAGAAAMGSAGSAAGPVGALGGGLLGQTIGAGVTGAVEDLALQQAGKVTGINERIDPMQTAVVGGVSAVLPGVFRGIGAGVSGSKRLLKEGVVRLSEKAAKSPRLREAKREVGEFLAEFAGFRDLHALPPLRQLLRRAETMPFKLPSLDDAAQITRRVLDGVSGRQFREEVPLRELVSGLRVDVTDEVSALARASSASIGDEGKRSAFETIRNDVLGLAGLSESATTRVETTPFVSSQRKIRTTIPRSGGKPGPEINPATGDIVGDPFGSGVSGPGFSTVSGVDVDPITGATIVDVTGGGSRLSRGPRAINFGTDAITGKNLPVIVDGETALEMKRLFGKLAADAGIFDSRFLPQAGKSAEKRVAVSFDSVRGKIRGALDEGQQAVFDQLNTTMERRQRAIARLERSLGGKTGNEARLQLGSQRDPTSPEAIIKAAFSDTNSQFRRALKEIDELYSSELDEMWAKAIAGTPAEELAARGLVSRNRRLQQLAEDARIGTEFGEDTIPNLLPPFTSVGQFRGPAIAGAAMGAAGFGAGGPLGAAAGMGIGLSIASPRILTGMTRALAINRTPQKAVRATLNRLAKNVVTDNLPPAIRAQAFSAFQEGVKRLLPDDRPVLREDAKRKELEGRR